MPGFPANAAETNCVPPVQDFVRTIAGRNPEIAVHVISFQYPFTAGTYSWNRVTVHALAGNNRRFPRRLWTWIRAVVRFFALRRSHHVIAIHSMWLTECAQVGAWLSRIGGVRHIASIQGQDALSQNRYLKTLPLQQMTITAGSAKAADAFGKNTGRKVDYVIPTGLDLDIIPPRARAAECSIDILGVGSLTVVKDYATFLQIVSILRIDFPEIRCCIIGDGPLRPQLERYIHEHHLEHTVRLAGRQSREYVLDTMRHSRILLHTARYEGQGYVFLEALASGMEVVSSDVGYPEGCDGMYRCDSVEMMVQTLRKLLSSTVKPQRTDVLSIEETAASFEKLYRNV